MRWKLLKAISCIALMVSVFFCSPSLAFADDVDSSEIEIQGFETTYDMSLLSDLDEDDYVGSSIFQVLSQKTNIDFVYTGENLDDGGYTLVGSESLPVYFTIGFQVERGHTYSGAVITKGRTSVSVPDVYDVGSFALSDVYVIAPDNIDVTLYPVLVYSSDAEAEYTFNINFNNWQSTYDGYVYINVMLEFDLTLIRLGVRHPGYYSPICVSTSVHASDWAGSLKDYTTDAIVDSDGSLIKNQTIQQQQIADQQSQQSAQQHDSLINGYDNAANDSMLADKNSVLQGFEQQQDQAISSGQQHVADFSAQYDTAIFATMAPSFALVSTMFNTLWNGMGQFSTVLIIGLVLCVAGYILKLKH